MNCKKCGSPILENEQYCRNCGESVLTLENQNNNVQQVNNINNSVVNGTNMQTNINNNISSTYKLILRRKKAFAGWAATFDIYIDNVLVGKVKNGQTIELEVSSGVHQISVNQNNPINITINGNTTADLVVFGLNNYGISNVNGQSINNNNDNAFIQKNVKSTNYVFIASLAISIISIVMLVASGYYITFWIYPIIIGYSILNIAGLNNQKQSSNYNKLMTKNIIAIVISTIMLLVTIYLTAFL